jgi:putative transposase
MRRSPRLEEALPVLYLRGLSTGDLSEVLKALLGRESTESWASQLRDLKRRGMPAPVLAVGDSGLGFWAALREVYRETQEQHR